MKTTQFSDNIINMVATREVHTGFLEILDRDNIIHEHMERVEEYGPSRRADDQEVYKSIYIFENTDVVTNIQDLLVEMKLTYL